MRRIGFASVLATGLSLVALGFQGVAGVDSRLEAATRAPAPQTHDASLWNVSERDCPRERRSSRL